MIGIRRQLEHMFAATAATVLLPAFVLATSVVVSELNTTGVRYTLPEWLYASYMAGIVLGPVMGVGVLATLWGRRRSLVYVASDAEARVRDGVVVTAMLAILLDAVWLALFPYVFFAAGGSR